MTKHEVIYLQDEGDPKLYAEIEVTWCSDRVNDDDTKYVLAEKLTKCQRQRDGLEAESGDLFEVLDSLVSQLDKLPSPVIDYMSDAGYIDDARNLLNELQQKRQAVLASVQNTPKDRQEYLKRLHEQITQDDTE